MEMNRETISLAKLTSTQERILRFVDEKLLAGGSAPSQEEIAERFGYRSLRREGQAWFSVYDNILKTENQA